MLLSLWYRGRVTLLNVLGNFLQAFLHRTFSTRSRQHNILKGLCLCRMNHGGLAVIVSRRTFLLVKPRLLCVVSCFIDSSKHAK